MEKAHPFIAALTRRAVRVVPGHGHNIQVCCPFCRERGETEDTRFRLGINLATQEGHCFNCGWRSRNAAGTLLLKKLGVRDGQMPRGYGSVPEPEPVEDVVLPEGFVPLLRMVGKCEIADAAMAYLTGRGVTRQQVRRHGVGICYLGQMAYRLVFPVYHGDDLKMLVGRAFIGKTKLRYLNTPGDKYLWGARGTAKMERCVLSEGIFKALSLEKVVKADGYTSLALLGHDVTPTQMQHLQDLGVKEITVWPDPDTVGFKGAVRAADMLRDKGYGKCGIFMVPPPPLQADEMKEEERHHWWSLRNTWSWGNRTKIKGLACR